MTTTPAEVVFDQGQKLLERYKVSLVPVDEIRPSPENTDIYGPTDFENDPALVGLVRSVERIGLEEPLILTADGYILSGHRRFFVVRHLGWDRVPARFTTIRRSDTADYHRLLTQYNPQRVKAVASTLAEALLARQDEAGDVVPWTEYRKRRRSFGAVAMEVEGEKHAKPIGSRRQEFLRAAQREIAALRDYWPLSVRQVHYKLLNNPPLMQTTGKADEERWRYRNDPKCYAALSRLLVDARYTGKVPWEAIDDATRETKLENSYASVTEYIGRDVETFLHPDYYRRNRQEGQAHHVELLVEKNTLLNIVSEIADKFGIPCTALRGYGGPSVWREIEGRWEAADERNGGDRATKCVLIVISDHDPEGLNLADDAVRSLRDRHDLDVEAVRCGLTLEQIEEHDLPSNPAKESSSRYQEYVERTGTTETWEVEALDPEVLRRELQETILGVLDVDTLNAVREREAAEKRELRRIKSRLSAGLTKIMGEMES